MAKRKPKRETKTPKVRIGRPAGRPYQLRYNCPNEQREIRISCGTRDEDEAQRQKAELEAKLLLGLPGQKKRATLGPHMKWEDFREEYFTTQLSALRDSTAQAAVSRLDIAEAIVRPRTLADMADGAALHRLQARLQAGAQSRYKRPRSAFTVKGYMRALLTSLNWAHAQGWLPSVPVVRLVKTSKLRAMRGRPLEPEEFQLMLEVVPDVVGEGAAASWRYILRGLWESALRIDELMHVSWDLPETIRPTWADGRLPVLEIPASLQKNDVEESIPLLPGFEAMLLETSGPLRTGWAFWPDSLQGKYGRKSRDGRPSAEWVGKIITRIGKHAKVVVEAGNPSTGKAPKYASSHDLRRSCADRLLAAGVPERIVQQVLRHASFETTRRHYAPTDVQRSAEQLRVYLGTSGAEEAKSEPADVSANGETPTG